ncbi:MAG: GTPase HflX [Pseudomonadota bacterium]|nr:GTPase HflX [Pseudomonadota bacterium]
MTTGASGARTILIDPVDPARATRSSDSALEEAIGLCEAIDLDVIHAETLRLDKPKPATLIGGGKVEELAARVEEDGVELCVIDATLSPTQQRNLERQLKCKVIDRTGLILEIFGARAQTAEGRLQVELAHLQYQRSRLVRSWTHLERQRGGAGFLGGPGESQIELDRRQLDDRIIRLKQDLQEVKRTRGLHRKLRKDVPHPVVALVGYTNAGKSTLFNRLSGASVLAKDQLFATLDPTMRAVRLGDGRAVVLSDTVGFVADLPTQLVAAFRATLEEVIEADIILHVRDAAQPDADAQARDVYTVLESLGVETGDNARLVEVWNKADLLDPDARAIVAAQARDREWPGVMISAVSGEGLDALAAEVARRVDRDRVEIEDMLDPSEGAALAWLYRNGEITRREDTDDGIRLTVRLTQADAGRWQKSRQSRAAE